MSISQLTINPPNSNSNYYSNSFTFEDYLRCNPITTIQRNGITGANGLLIYNNDNNEFEGYINGSWSPIGNMGPTGPTGSSTGNIFFSGTAGTGTINFTGSNTTLFIQLIGGGGGGGGGTPNGGGGGGAGGYQINSMIDLSLVSSSPITYFIGSGGTGSSGGTGIAAPSGQSSYIIYNGTGQIVAPGGGGGYSPTSFNVGGNGGVGYYGGGGSRFGSASSGCFISANGPFGAPYPYGGYPGSGTTGYGGGGGGFGGGTGANSSNNFLGQNGINGTGGGGGGAGYDHTNNYYGGAGGCGSITYYLI